MLFNDDDLQKEFDFLKAFVWVNSVNSVRETKARENLHALWTAFCLHHGLPILQQMIRISRING